MNSELCFSGTHSARNFQVRVQVVDVVVWHIIIINIYMEFIRIEWTQNAWTCSLLFGEFVIFFSELHEHWYSKSLLACFYSLFAAVIKYNVSQIKIQKASLIKYLRFSDLKVNYVSFFQVEVKEWKVNYYTSSRLSIYL